MSESMLRFILIGWITIAVIVFILLFFVSAPYGRHFRKNFGPSVSARLGWILMESPAPLVFLLGFYALIEPVTIVSAIFLLMWETHYVDRSFIYPLTLRRSTKPVPVSILLAGMIFNSMNAYLNIEFLHGNAALYSEAWLSDIRFLSGVAVFLFGFAVNRHSDYILYQIRKGNGYAYAIPQNGLYRYISCPNYFGEILIWVGWTFATWSPVALAFAVWSIANLAPRARSHHRWYKEQFPDYPEKRHILVPWLW
jgi:3-oxo-5-alpha-steroid 4-dehydrogenase 1